MQTKVERSGIRSLTDAVTRRWWLALCVAIPLFAGVVLYTERLPSVYEAQSIVSFSTRKGADVGADVIRLTLPRYTVFATSPQVLTEVAATTGVDESDVKAALDAKIQTDTANVAISALTKQHRLNDEQRKLARQQREDVQKFMSLLQQEQATLYRKVTAVSTVATDMERLERNLRSSMSLHALDMLGYSSRSTK